MNDIQQGDLVVCVDASPQPRHRGLRYSDADIARFVRFLSVGRHYRVTHVTWTEALRLAGDQLPLADDASGYHPDRFRKINDEQDNAELIAKIRACKPIKEHRHA